MWIAQQGDKGIQSVFWVSLRLKLLNEFIYSFVYVALSIVTPLRFLPPFRGKILVLYSCLFTSWRWKQKFYLQRWYPFTVATISKIRTQRREFYLNPFTKPVSFPDFKPQNQTWPLDSLHASVVCCTAHTHATRIFIRPQTKAYHHSNLHF